MYLNDNELQAQYQRLQYTQKLFQTQESRQKQLLAREAISQEEYDIVMTNGDAIGIVEVKYKAHEKDLKKLERKMRNFKKLFPVYENYKLYGAIASFHIYPEAKAAALNQGFFVLQRSGKVMQTDCGENLLVM